MRKKVTQSQKAINLDAAKLSEPKKQLEVMKTRSQGKWTDDEHQRFVEAVKKYGKDYKQIVKHVGTRIYSSVATHAYNFKKEIKADPSLPNADLLSVLE